MEQVFLEPRLVGNISGDFFIADYQRGYRWKEEVEMLLNDISEVEEGKNYCLQPIVVKRVNNKYELIDGQQRLTTLYLIQKFTKTYCPRIQIKYSIEYQTRENSKAILENINFDNLNENPQNIDEYFINESARTIKNWFEKFNNENEKKYTDDDAANDIQTKLNNKVHVIWYEVDSSENSTNLFTRLNIGKIPLTNAELVKALFLSRNNGIDNNKQLEIATQWDVIEKELGNDNFWYFITNESTEKYSTRIELIFNLMADKQPSDKERFRTFFFFNDKIKDSKNKTDVWVDILRYYQRLKEWYENFEVYHKVGYLVATGFKLQDLLNESNGKTKSDFQNSLDEKIAKTIDFKKDYNELSYEKSNEKSMIEKLLLLFNVETIRQKQDEFMRFPFERHKKENWSLEHIHAQNSEGLNKNEARKEWLVNHKKSLESLQNGDLTTGLIEECEKVITKIDDTKDKSNVEELFTPLFEKIIKALSENGDVEEIHTLDNMALLSAKNNSTLNNSTFDVKRNKIIELDKTIEYLPVCTKRVFLKYYTPSDKNQLHFWGKDDRVAYIKNMNEVLKPYFSINNKEIEL